LIGAIEALAKRAVKSGDIRRDLDPFDLLRALIGVSNLVQPGVATNRQETGGYSHHRFAPIKSKRTPI